MILEKLFPTEEAKNEAIEHFAGLKDNPDWVFLVEKLIKADIEDLSQKLLDPNHEWKPGEDREQKRIRAYWIILSELPQALITALRENKPDIFLEADPYFKTTKEIEESKKKKKKR